MRSFIQIAKQRCETTTPMMHLGRGFVFILAWLSLTISSSAQAVIGGDPAGVPPDSPALRVDPNKAGSPWAGVGSVSVDGTAYSGVLISPYHVLTAAHVAAGALPGAIAFILNAGADSSHCLAVRRIFVHPEYAGFTAKANQVVSEDLAILELAEPAPSGVPVYPLLHQPILPGTVITFVGYGAGGDGVHGVTVPGSASVKRIGANRADQLLPDNAPATKRKIYMFDFDGPDLTSNRIGVNRPPNGTLGNRVEATLGPGDSGSPAFVKIPLRGWHLVGINTFVDHIRGGPDDPTKFGNGAGGMLLYPYLEWIRAIVNGVHG